MELNTRDSLILFLYNNFPEYVREMKKTDHMYKPHPDDVILNQKYHLEDSVWTHMITVMTIAENVYKSQLLMTVAMLHDIGKCFTQRKLRDENDIPYKFSFEGHEGVSTWLAIDILNAMTLEDPFYSTSTKLLILQIISLHGLDYSNLQQHDVKLYMYLEQFRTCDRAGSVREFGAPEKSSPRKFCTASKKDDKHLILLGGLQCSGKSTLSQKYKDEGYFYISRDEHLDLYFDQLLPAYKNVSSDDKYKCLYSFPALNTDFNIYFDRYLSESKKKHDKIIIDMTMLTARKRRAVLNTFSNFHVECHFLLVGKQELLKRCKERDTETFGYWDMIKRSSMLTLPIKSEGFDKVELYLHE